MLRDRKIAELQAQARRTAMIGDAIGENHGKTMGKPWENGDLYGKLWKDPPFSMGKSHDFDWVIFNSYVKLPEGSLW